MILATILADLRPTQRTGTIKINIPSIAQAQFPRRSPDTDPLADQHGSFMQVSQIIDLSNQEIGNI
jgi:hypothetical protein